MLQKFLFSSLCTILFGMAGMAQAATWQVLGGSVSVAPDSNASSPAFNATLSPGIPGTLIEGSYQGADEIFRGLYVASDDPNFAWNYRMDFYTAEFSNAGSPLAPPGINLAGGYADMSSFRISWYEVGFESAGATLVPLLLNADGSYRLIWELQGGFSSSGTATMSMDIAAVPLPAAVWLLGSGLLGLVGVNRRFGRRAPLQ